MAANTKIAAIVRSSKFIWALKIKGIDFGFLNCRVRQSTMGDIALYMVVV